MDTSCAFILRRCDGKTDSTTDRLAAHFPPRKLQNPRDPPHPPAAQRAKPSHPRQDKEPARAGKSSRGDCRYGRQQLLSTFAPLSFFPLEVSVLPNLRMPYSRSSPVATALLSQAPRRAPSDINSTNEATGPSSSASRRAVASMSSSTVSMRAHRIGGPLLDSLPFNVATSGSSAASGGCHRRPVITPPVSTARAAAASDDDAVAADARQYLLLPSRRTVDVLSMENGRVVGRLAVASSDEDDGTDESDVEINSVCLARVSVVMSSSDSGSAGNVNRGSQDSDDEDDDSSSDDDDDDEDAATMKDVSVDDILSASNNSDGSRQRTEWVILAGCTDGTVREWNLREAVLQSNFGRGGGSNSNKNKNAKKRGGRGGGGASAVSIGEDDALKPRRVLPIVLAGTEVEDKDGDGNVDVGVFGKGKGQTNNQSKTAKAKKHKMRLNGVTHLSCPPTASNVGALVGTTFALVQVDEVTTRLVKIGIPPSPPKKVANGVGGATSAATAVSSIVELGTFSLKRKGEAKVDRRRKKKEKKAAAAAATANGADDTDGEMDGDSGGSNGRKKVFKVQALPFDLLTAISGNSGDEDMSVVVVTKAGLAIYSDKLAATYDTEGGAGAAAANTPESRIVYYAKTRHYNRIVSACVAPNGSDVAVGYAEGFIDIYVGILDLARSYVSSPEGNRTMANVIIRSVHWHAHAVASLAFMGATAVGSGSGQGGGGNGGGSSTVPSLNLLSGAEEAVLATWSLERGTNRPVHTLPRLAKGGIVNIVANPYVPSNVDIAVYCTDNSLRLINGYNYSTKWRIQGLAEASAEPAKSALVVSPPPACPGTVLLHDPRTRLPILTNLPGAPGSIQWYDPSCQRVVGTLEVAPYNRISRRSPDDPSVPAPQVTHLCLSESGDDMITIDTILTENTGSGGARKVRAQGGTGSEESMTLFTTIKFWTWSKGAAGKAGSRKDGSLDMPYELISAMPLPHGLAGEVSSLAMTSDGSRACTLSHEEGAFRVWAKGKNYESEHPSSAEPRAPLWKCLYKITTPAGFARAMPKSPSVPGQQLAFSSDGSVLAVCYGEHVALWDHTNSALLTSVKNIESICDVQFTRTGADMLLLRGKTSVALQAPFGTNNRAYAGGSWSYSLTRQGDLANLPGKVDVLHAVSIASKKEIAVALWEKASNITSVVVLDEITGDAKTSGRGPLCWMVPDKIQALYDVSRNDSHSAEGTSRLVALTNRHELLSLESIEISGAEGLSSERPEYDLRSKSEAFGVVGNTTSGAPTLNSIVSTNNKRRKKNKDYSFGSDQDVVARFGNNDDGSSSKSAPLPSAELPTLSGNFARDFIGRSLRR